MTIKELEIKVNRLEKQLNKQHETVMALFDYIKSRTRGRRKREMIDIVQSMLW